MFKGEAHANSVHVGRKLFEINFKTLEFGCGEEDMAEKSDKDFVRFSVPNVAGLLLLSGFSRSQNGYRVSSHISLTGILETIACNTFVEVSNPCTAIPR
mmetsp:Transcript_1433/g.2061  ORF Transcript_1433/g.2061 Transcript_1433/m.2061 type:complete len:99 (-) Transcript_1433:172-468(-)